MSEKIYKLYFFCTQTGYLSQIRYISIIVNENNKELLNKFDPYYNDQKINDESWKIFQDIINIASYNIEDFFIIKNNAEEIKVFPTYIIPEDFKSTLPRCKATYKYDKDHKWKKNKTATIERGIEVFYYINLINNLYNYTLENLEEEWEDKIKKGIKQEIKKINCTLSSIEFLDEIENKLLSDQEIVDHFKKHRVDNRDVIEDGQNPYGILNHPLAKTLKSKNIPILKPLNYNELNNKNPLLYQCLVSTYVNAGPIVGTGISIRVMYINLLILEAYNLQFNSGEIESFFEGKGLVNFKVEEIIRNLVKIIEQCITLHRLINSKSKSKIIDTIGMFLDSEYHKQFNFGPNDIELLDYLNQINNHKKHHINDLFGFSYEEIGVYGDFKTNDVYYRHSHTLRVVIAGFNSIFHRLINAKSIIQ